MKIIFLLIITLTLALTQVTGSAVIHPTNTGRPGLLIDEALTIANQYAATHQIEASQHYIDSARLGPDGDTGKLWMITWLPNENVKGGEIYMQIYMDKSVKVSRGR
ncbi:MAG TPA: hypothetical protein VGC66_04080 [Pyrinomonadaceae bacterium]|jgi:hypothetical protein